MFQWFKKKTDKEKKPAAEREEPQLSEAEKALSYEKIGLWYAELDDSDEAIAQLEKSLEAKLSMGEGYKKLMSLYNAKRAQAARNKDNEAIDYYMAKMDEMRNIAKKLTLSKD